MRFRSTPRDAERLSALSVGLAAAITSALISGWAPLSLVGRSVVFFGALASAFLLARWAARASTPGRAFAKSVLGGAIQANVAGSTLVVLALLVDTMLGTAPSDNHYGDAFGLMLVVAIVGSVIGAGIGVLYGFVPAYVVASRDERSHATLDRVFAANGAWLFVVGLAHLVLLQLVHAMPSSTLATALLFATVLVPVLLGLALVTTGIVRAHRRRSFVARVHAGLEPRYRVVPIEEVSLDDALPVENVLDRRCCRSAIVRVAEEEDRAVGYRENASPPEERRALALL